jgi:hypothetical protein
MSVIDAVNATGGVRTAFEESARASLHSTLDALHHLAESLLLSQMLGIFVIKMYK